MKTYRVKEVFATLQGEGWHAGRAAVFVRFSGCNLWDGTEAGRARGKASCAKWCDTDFVDGENYTRSQLLDKVLETWRGGIRARFIVFTGGEPTLQLDGDLLAGARARGFFCAVESNGLSAVPDGVDWLTVSPKTPKINVTPNEIKLVYPQGLDPKLFESSGASCLFLQPLDIVGEQVSNLAACITYCQANPQWRLSSQQHKTWGIP